MALRLYAKHDPTAQAGYQELKRLALGQGRVAPGTPGTLRRIRRRSTDYWVREYVRADGKRGEDYLGTEAALGAKGLAELQAQNELARELAARSARMRLLNYQRVERPVAAVLGALHNRGLFGGGLVLVGSHAFASLLNELGIVAAGYKTQDLDVARAQPLAVALPPQADFRALLNESGLDFVAVPGMPSRSPSVSFKRPGAHALAVDLLAPGKTLGAVVPVRELGAHAQAVPFLEFLVKEPIDSIALNPSGAIPVKTPSPERYALHKLLSSQSRRTDRDKQRKDLQQAAVLAAALEDEMPGTLAAAFGGLPVAARATVRLGAKAAAGLLAGSHPEAHAALRRLAR